MKLDLTHNENIKNFAYISSHIELEVECLGSHHNTVHVAQDGQRKAFRPKRNKQGRHGSAIGKLGPKQGNEIKCSQGKRSENKDKTKVNCYNYGKLGYFS